MEGLLPEANESREERNAQQADVEDDISGITSEETEMALRNTMKSTATGQENLPVEVWKSLVTTGVSFLKEALNKIADEEKIPDICVFIRLEKSIRQSSE